MSPVKYKHGGFPPKTLNWEKLIPLIGPANAALAHYDALLAAIPNPMVLLSPLTTQEAVLSSRIEGTQATLSEALEFEAIENRREISEEKRGDIQEILNYRKAMRLAMKHLKKLPLSGRVILAAHKVLMDSVRGHGKSPGAYRKIPNYIVPLGRSEDNATFVPMPVNQIPEGMSQLEHYIHDENVPDKLLQLAVVHAEFEIIHPFLDGNGRLGRMLIPLFLWQKGMIRDPVFYISAFFEANRDEYYERLLAISRDDDWSGWCMFFLDALKQQADSNAAKASAILKLYNKEKESMVASTRSRYSIYALDWIFERPVFKGSDFVKNARIPAPTARRILSVLRENKLLRTIYDVSGPRSKVYAFTELLNIVKEHSVFRKQ